MLHPTRIRVAVGTTVAVIAVLLTLGAAPASAAPPNESIYWADEKGSVQVGNLDGAGAAATLISGQSAPCGVAIDPAADRIYWTDFGSHKIMVANLDGSGVDELFTGENGACGVAIDHTAGKIYWANYHAGTIRVANLDGTGTALTLFDAADGVSNPSGLMLYMPSSRIYWTNQTGASPNTSGTIQYGPVTGGTATVLYDAADGVNQPIGLAIVPSQGRFYWANYGDNTIRYGSSNGTVPANSLLFDAGDGVSGPAGVAIDYAANRAYWANFIGGTIQYGGLNGGTATTMFSGLGQYGPNFPVVLRAPETSRAPVVFGGFDGTLTCSQGTWPDVLEASLYRAPQSFAYQWLLDGTEILGEAKSTYKPIADGSYVCRVTASNQVGSTSRGSAPFVMSATAAWQRETVDPSVPGWYSSLALDDDGMPHVAYRSSGNVIKYAWYDGTTWRGKASSSAPDVVSTGTNCGYVVSLALDDDMHPHIAFAVGSPAFKLRYANWDGNAWVVGDVQASTHWVGLFPSLVIDSEGRPHISYIDCSGASDSRNCSSGGLLMYATTDGTTWTRTAVDTSPSFSINSFTSLALTNGSSPEPRIAYYDATNNRLRYAQRSAGVWSSGTVNVSSNPLPGGVGASLALYGDEPRIAYTYNNQLHYAARNGGLWSDVPLGSSSAGITQQSPLAFDYSGVPHIAYPGSAGGKMAILHRWFKGTDWQNATHWGSEPAPTSGVYGLHNATPPSGNVCAKAPYQLDELAAWYPSLALDGAGQPHATYFIQFNCFQNRTYAYGEGPLVYVRLGAPPPGNTAPVAVDDDATFDEDAPATDVPVLQNDSDPDNDLLTITDASDPDHGTVVVAADGTGLTYTPDLNYCNFGGSPDTFTYTISDGRETTTATVSVTVNCVNDAPEAQDLSVTTDEDVAVSLILDATDVDGESLAYQVTTGPFHGTLSGTAPNLTYTPAANWNGSDSLTYEACDNGSPKLCDTASVSITVTPVNDAPMAKDLSLTTDEDVAVSVTLVGTDVDADPLTYQVTTGPSHGSLSGTAPNLTYTPVANWNGADGLTYKVCDNGSPKLCDTATVSIAVAPVNDPPWATFSPTSPTAQYSDPMAPVTVTGQDVDNPATTLRFPSATGLPAGVSLKDNLDGTATISGTPTAKAAAYNVTVTVTDGLASASVPVTLTVTRENALVLYSGEWLAQLGSTPLPMRATVMDSAAVGYTGANPETGAGATIGDITKMKVAFEIFGGTSCTGTSTKTVEAWVTDGPTVGDGIGTATASLTNPGGSNEVTYCVRAGIAGDYYTGDYAQTAGVSFYQNSGQFATGGGWIVDPNRGKGNFGLNGRYTKQGAPKGQMVYVFRDLYNGVQADFVIKSSAITQLAFGGTVYPISATLQGKASIQVIRASDGALLYGDGNATFISRVVDSGKSSGIGSDSFSLAVYDKNGVQYKTVPTTVLSGGNVVVHAKK